MRRIVAFVILAGLYSSCVTPIYGRADTSAKSQTPASQKAARKQQKALKKYMKAQQKAQRKMAKRDRKNTHYPKRSF